MSLSEVKHQERALRVLRYALKSDRVPHAYIFHGPEGVGRELSARHLGTLMLCEQAGDDACGRCQSCTLSTAETHPDFHVIYRSLIKQHPDAKARVSKGQDLGVDVIRHFVIDRVARRAAMGRGKVFVIREAEKMNPHAQNALLKTLEEPPPATVVILISASPDALLPTVRSRCQTVPFGLLPASFIEEQLPALHPDITSNEARFCAMHADGSLGVAARHYEDRLIEYDARMVNLMGELGRTGAAALAKRMVEDAASLGACDQRRDPEITDTEAQRRGLRMLMALIATGIRTSLQVCVGAQGDHDGDYSTLADRLTPRQAVDAVRSILTSERQLARNVNVALCVEGLLIRLSRVLAS